MQERCNDVETYQPTAVIERVELRLWIEHASGRDMQRRRWNDGVGGLSLAVGVGEVQVGDFVHLRHHRLARRHLTPREPIRRLGIEQRHEAKTLTVVEDGL